jgi:hypothetical protein
MWAGAEFLFTGAGLFSDNNINRDKSVQQERFRPVNLQPGGLQCAGIILDVRGVGNDGNALGLKDASYFTASLCARACVSDAVKE